MNYYRRYVGDYLRKTSKLSMLEHGAYCLLLDYYYAEECPVPLDLDDVCRMVRAMRSEERKAIEKVLALYFTKEPDGFRHDRVDREIAVAQSTIAKQRDSGAESAAKRWSTNGSKDGLHDGYTDRSTHAPPIQPPTTNHQPPDPTTEPPAFQPPSARKTRANRAFALPDWIPPVAWDGYAEMRNRLRKPMTDLGKELAVAELEKLCGRDEARALAILNQSIFQGWQGLFPLKTNGSGLQDGAAEYLRQEKETSGERIR